MPEGKVEVARCTPLRRLDEAEVSACSTSRVRSSTGTVARHRGPARPIPPRRQRPAPHPASIGAIDPKPRRSTRWCGITSRPCSAPSTTGRLRCASPAMPGRNSSPTWQGQPERDAVEKMMQTQLPSWQIDQHDPCHAVRMAGSRSQSTMREASRGLGLQALGDDREREAWSLAPLTSPTDQAGPL